MAAITEDFSFAYLKEAFVSTLLELARTHDGDDEEEENAGDDDGDDELNKYEFWRVFKAQVKMLRSDMGEGGGGSSAMWPACMKRGRKHVQVEVEAASPQGQGATPENGAQPFTLLAGNHTPRLGGGVWGRGLPVSEPSLY